MILVDSSVWIAHLRRENPPLTARLRALAASQTLLIGDIILLEIFQGARNDLDAHRLQQDLQKFTIVPLLNASLASRAAENYRKLRALGITIRKTADLIIGTYCIAQNHKLFHNDRDFIPMEVHLGLQPA